MCHRPLPARARHGGARGGGGDGRRPAYARALRHRPGRGAGVRRRVGVARRRREAGGRMGRVRGRRFLRGAGPGRRAAQAGPGAGHVRQVAAACAPHARPGALQPGLHQPGGVWACGGGGRAVCEVACGAGGDPRAAAPVHGGHEVGAACMLATAAGRRGGGRASAGAAGGGGGGGGGGAARGVAGWGPGGRERHGRGESSAHAPHGGVVMRGLCGSGGVPGWKIWSVGVGPGLALVVFWCFYGAPRGRAWVRLAALCVFESPTHTPRF
mmetsp:Transcript_81206/g.218377  ORF Transcript_81206/g.218377 Transcript_81206/m.218377 type:complete len:269 (-) Transcript_81206:57-863(-)